MDPTLRRGDGIFTAFGSRGQQYALVHHWNGAGDLFVVKWRVKSGSWTKPVRVLAGEYMRRAMVKDPDQPRKVTQAPHDIWALKSGLVSHPSNLARRG